MASKNSGNSETEEDFSFLNIAKTNPAVIKDKVLQERLALLQGKSPANSAKRGRTETTSPPERPPTPEARLGDWMRRIEETITAQANEIKSLEAMVEQLREEIGKDVRTFLKDLETNIEEFAESMQIEEIKATASVEDLRGTFDVQFKAAAETTEKKIKDSVEAARAETVRSMVNQAKRIEEIRTGFDEQIREAVNQVVKEKLEVTDRPKFKKSAANGIFFTGLDVIAKREKMQGDITSVVHNILHKVGSAPYYTDVIAVDPKNTPRSSAKNAIIYFQSVYHKNHAAAQIRMMLF